VKWSKSETAPVIRTFVVSQKPQDLKEVKAEDFSQTFNKPSINLYLSSENTSQRLFICATKLIVCDSFRRKFGFRDPGSRETQMFIWHENEGARTSQEISFCLLRYIADPPPPQHYSH
jgi:hypothetical protein